MFWYNQPIETEK